MTQKVRWRLAHIIAVILGAILLALTARQALVINSPDLRTGALATSSMAAFMVGLILLVRFLASRQRPTLYLTLGFLGSGVLLDLIARTGGDEFCVLLAEPDEGIQLALARLRQNVDDSNDAGTRRYRLDFSVGIARAKPDEDESIHALVEMADEAMYQEKRLREGAA